MIDTAPPPADVPEPKPQRGARILRRRAAIILILIFVITLSAALGSRLVRGLQDLRAAPLDNIQWALSQTEVEHLRYWNALLNAMETRGSAQMPAALAAVRQRFDLLYSRVSMLTEGQLFAGLRDAPEARAGLDRLTAFLEQTAEAIDGDNDQLAARLPDLRADAEDLFTTIRKISLEGVGIFAVLSDQERGHFQRLLVAAFLVAALFILLLLGLLYITARHRQLAERRGKEVARGRARLGSVVSASLDGIIVVDAGGRVLEFNGAAEEIFGYAREDAIGRDIAGLIVPPSLRDAHQVGMDRLRRTGEKRVADQGRIEIAAMRKDGSEFPVELSVRSVKAGSELSFVAFVRDITDQRAAAEALEKARDQALAADRAKSSFVAMMSHEMRTPLNGLIGMIDMLDSTDLTPLQRNYLRIANSSGELLLRHVNDVLDIAQLESHEIELEEVPIDLGILISEVIEINQVTASQKSLMIRLVADPMPYPVYVDAHRLRQLLMNLIGNAVKFTEGGSVGVEVIYRDIGRDQMALEIAVSDTGPGIPKSEQERVFEDFVTLQNGYDRRETGSGLGLAISRRIACAMGGTLTLCDAPGGGSIFTIALGLHRAEAGAVELSQLAASGVAYTRRSVLVVEDNDVNRQVARSMLETLGHEVTEACDGAIGVRLASKQRFDLVLMDVSMPGIDGLEATRRIRELPAPYGNVPIIGLTAHAMPAERARFAAAGMQRCLIKPIRRAMIVQALSAMTGPQAELEEHPPGGGMVQEMIDVDLLAELAATASETVFADLLHKIIDDISNAVPQVQAAIAAHDLAVAKRMAHQLTGTAGLVGATALTELLAQIETAAESGTVPGENLRRALGWVASQTTEILKEFANRG